MRNIFITLLVLGPMLSGAQQRIAEDIQVLLKNGVEFRHVDLLHHESDDLRRVAGLSGVHKGTLLQLDLKAISDIQTGDAPFISLTLPTSDRRMITLDLVEHDVFMPGFRLYTSDNPTEPTPYTRGKYYRGMIHGDIASVVSISIFNDEIIGLISSDAGNLVLGKIRGSRDHLHILYYDADLTTRPDWGCGTVDDGMKYTKEQLLPPLHQRDAGDCVKVYIEIDDDIVTDKGGAMQATNYITGLFNQAITLYDAEGIEMTISEVYAWTTPSPYSGGTASAMLASYQNLTGSFNGDLSHLVSYQASGGVAAGYNGICNSNPDLSKCFSSIDATYEIVPTYSWSAMVITHEMGHLIGSRHTHACVWNGNNTAIDGCGGSTEGGCQLPENPPEGGTMMSYCHLENVGINFNLGFGPQPGNVIRNTVNSVGNCLMACGGPPPPLEYCASEGSIQQYEWIQTVELESINNPSGENGGYADFTALSTTLFAGGTYTLTLTPGFSGTAYTEFWGVWIDYNDDKDWNDAGEMVASGSGYGAVNLLFTVPVSAAFTKTRMRVSMQYNAVPPVCGIFTYGEVEDYTIAVAGSEPTCDDGIQNGDETGIDCGGSICPACPTCDDGIQNGDEEGVDCGGSCPAGCAVETVMFGHYFESGWDGWADGGSDCARYFGSRSWEGNYSINIQDNSGVASSMTSPAVDLLGYAYLELEFYFYSSGMENGEDIWVRYYDGFKFSTVAAIIAGTHFNNGNFWVATVTIMSSEVNFVSNARLRIQCDASDDSDDIYIDAVTLTAFNNSLPRPGFVVSKADKNNGQGAGLGTSRAHEVVILPNPATDNIQVDFNGAIDEIRIISAQGIELKTSVMDATSRAVDLSNIPGGMYVLMIRSGDTWTAEKFVKL